MADESRRFLLLLEIGKVTPQRVQTLVPALTRTLTGITNGEYELLFRSVQADVFGYLLKSKLNAAQIRAALETPVRGFRMESDADRPFLEGTDKVFVVELGADFDGAQKFSRATTWLQRH